MTEAPSGIVTLLFTDIEGSTRLLQRVGDAAYVELLATHCRLLRSAFERHAGYEVGTEGDAFFITFRSAREAVVAAAEAQQALAWEDWPEAEEVRVRMGIHTGEPLLVDGNYAGLDVHRAARVMAAGHGGQVLLSQSTRELLEEPSNLCDLGEHRLKDLLRPLRLYQLLIDGLPDGFPALKTLNNRPNNLPTQTTELIGREIEIGEITATLLRDDVRLVTLTGPGGVGKTRLALQVAADAIDEFGSGAFFVSLAPIRNPELVVPAIAQALKLREQAEESLVETLTRYLSDKTLLLVLDNLERVTESALEIAAILKAAPHVKVLATSRAPLRVAGEHLYPVPPLGLPLVEDLYDTGVVSESEAVRLFITRAEAARPDFVLNAENARAIAEICIRVDGLPLAIELAAARTRALPPRAILRRLDKRLKLLTGGSRDLEERQQTMRATIKWSHDLLSDPERTLFARLAVFAGGCRIEAAQAVCDPDGELGSDVLDGLTSLVDQSLLRELEEPDGEPRFSMLETIREYALEQLHRVTDPDSAEFCDFDGAATRKSHAEYFVSLVETAGPLLVGPEQSRWLDVLERDHGNLRTALDWLEESGDVDTGARMAGVLSRFWYVHGHLKEGRAQLERLLQAAAGRPGTEPWATARVGAGLLAREQGDFAHARVLLEEAIRAYRHAKDQRNMARALYHLGILEGRDGRHSQARVRFQESLQAARIVKDDWAIASAWRGISHEYVMVQNYRQARSALDQSLRYFRKAHDPRGLAISLRFAAEIAIDLGDHPTARSQLRESLQILEALGDQWSINNALLATARLAAAEGDSERALRLAGAAFALCAEIGATLSPGDAERAERWLTPVREIVLADACDSLLEQGKALTVDEAVAYAIEEKA